MKKNKPQMVEEKANSTDKKSDNYQGIFKEDNTTFGNNTDSSVSPSATTYPGTSPITSASPSSSASPSPSESVSELNDDRFIKSEADLRAPVAEVNGSGIEDKTGGKLFELKGGIEISTEKSYRLHVCKEAQKHERCIKVDEYTDILFDFITSANGEFCFALFGDWGRGKTFLANNLCNKFEQYAKYLTINFNAWKYRDTPGIWIYLYETFINKVKKLGYMHYFIIALRTGYIKNSFLLIITTLLILGTLVIPPSIYTRFIPEIISGYTKLINLFIQSAALIFIFSKLIKPFDIHTYLKKLKNTYGQLTTHKEKLGIQEVIGNDLKSLIISLAPKQNFINTEYPFITDNIFYISNIIVAPILAILVNTNNNIFIPLLIYIYFLVLFIILPMSNKYNFNKILLVVDDLDRCGHDKLLDIIESLKIMIDDTELNDKIQIIFLLEEHILRYSIYKRFQDIVDRDETYIGDKFYHNKVNGHIEKILTSFLRLYSLSSNDCFELLDKYINYDPLNTGIDNIENEGLNKIDKNKLSSTVDTFIYTEEEKILLRNTYPQEEGWSPRRVRLFLLKYQLCRLIKERLNLDNITNKDIIDGLADNLLGHKLPDRSSSQRKEILWLINQVV